MRTPLYLTISIAAILISSACGTMQTPTSPKPTHPITRHVEPAFDKAASHNATNERRIEYWRDVPEHLFTPAPAHQPGQPLPRRTAPAHSSGECLLVQVLREEVFQADKGQGYVSNLHRTHSTYNEHGRMTESYHVVMTRGRVSHIETTRIDYDRGGRERSLSTRRGSPSHDYAIETRSSWSHDAHRSTVVTHTSSVEIGRQQELLSTVRTSTTYDLLRRPLVETEHTVEHTMNDRASLRIRDWFYDADGREVLFMDERRDIDDLTANGVDLDVKLGDPSESARRIRLFTTAHPTSAHAREPEFLTFGDGIARVSRYDSRGRLIYFKSQHGDPTMDAESMVMRAEYTKRPSVTLQRSRYSEVPGGASNHTTTLELEPGEVVTLGSNHEIMCSRGSCGVAQSTEPNETSRIETTGAAGQKIELLRENNSRGEVVLEATRVDGVLTSSTSYVRTCE